MHGVVVQTWTWYLPTGSLHPMSCDAVRRRPDVPIEHGVKGSNFVNADVGHVENLGDLIHGSNWKPTFG